MNSKITFFLHHYFADEFIIRIGLKRKLLVIELPYPILYFDVNNSKALTFMYRPKKRDEIIYA